MSKHSCKTCNGSGAYKSGLHLVVCPACDGSGDEPQPRTHTPGPWQVETTAQGVPMNHRRTIVTKHGVRSVVAEINGPYTPSYDRYEEDARLIAAAPELLVACVKANELLDNLMKAVPWGQTFDLDIAALNEVMIKLPAAIAKAKGGA